MHTYRADWVLPITAEPIRNGSVAVEGGRIARVHSAAVPGASDLGRVAVLPALVNAHTHLELSHLRGMIPRAPGFIDWVATLMAVRRESAGAAPDAIADAARAAIGEARAAGTGLLGDVSNTLLTPGLLRDARMPAQVFFELLGFNAPEPERLVREARKRVDALVSGHEGLVRVGIAPHAPYSVSPALFSAIRTDLDAQPRRVSTVHLGESSEEVEFVGQGTGPWRSLLEALGAWTEDWRPVGVSPVAYLDSLGFLDRRVLVVHGVQFSGEDLGRLRALNVTIAACPRSNRFVGVGPPPLEAFYAMDVDVAFGTDSLASVEDLNLFAELAEARRVAPRVSARRLLRSATLTGAEALGFGEDFGSLDVGKRARMIAVAIPEGVGDVEEYLVSGIRPADVAWLEG